MNIQDYIMMLQQQQQGGGEQPSSMMPPAPPGMQGAAPARGMRDPINQGSIDAIHRARESLSGKPKSLLGNVFSGLGDVAVGSLRGSPHEVNRQVGNAMMTGNESQALHMKQNMQIMQHLQQQQEMQAMMKHRANQEMGNALHMQEQARHNKAHEGFELHKLRETLAEKQQIKNEAKLREKQILDESGDKVHYIDSLPNNIRNKAIQRGMEYETQHEASGKSIEIGNRILEIARNNPDILNNWKYVAANRYTKDPGYLNQILMNLGLSDEEKSSLMEIESLVKEYNLATLKSFPSGTRPNQFLEQALFAANPSGKMPLPTLENAINKQNERNFHQYNETGKGYDYFRRGYRYETEARHISKEDLAKAKPGTHFADKNDEKEDLDRQIRELEQQIASHEKKED
jgi:hypothetical protein